MRTHLALAAFILSMVSILAFSPGVQGSPPQELTKNRPGLMRTEEPQLTPSESSRCSIEPGFGMYDSRPGSFLLAQAERGQSPRGAASKPDEQRHLQWLYSQMKDYLKLDEATSKRFEPVFREYAETRGRLTREQMTIMHQIVRDADNGSIPVKSSRKTRESIVRQVVRSGRRARRSTVNPEKFSTSVRLSS